MSASSSSVSTRSRRLVSSCCKLDENELEAVTSERLGQSEADFNVIQIKGVGRGVVSTRAIKKGAFVLEYVGELISGREGKKREKSHDGEHSYLYYFYFKNRFYCIDATKESPRKGRLINHSRQGNLRSKVIEIQKTPRMCFFAMYDIAKGTELKFDYGDYRPIALIHNPWLEDTVSDPLPQTRPARSATATCCPEPVLDTRDNDTAAEPDRSAESSIPASSIQGQDPLTQTRPAGSATATCCPEPVLDTRDNDTAAEPDRSAESSIPASSIQGQDPLTQTRPAGSATATCCPEPVLDTRDNDTAAEPDRSAESSIPASSIQGQDPLTQTRPAGSATATCCPEPVLDTRDNDTAAEPDRSAESSIPASSIQGQVREKAYSLRTRRRRISEVPESSGESSGDFGSDSSDDFHASGADSDSDSSEAETDPPSQCSEPQAGPSKKKGLSPRPSTTTSAVPGETSADEETTATEPSEPQAGPSKKKGLSPRPSTTTSDVPSETSSDEETTATEPSASSTHVRVDKIGARTGKTNRDWSKKYACVFCGQLVCKLVEHLTSKHSDENSVKEVLALPPKNKERALAIGKLRTAGTLKHNQEVLASGKGVLLCKKRVTEPNAPEHFKTCGYCGSLYAAASMYKHLQKCSLKPKDGVMPSRCTKAISTNALQYHRDVFSHDVMSKFRQNDSVTATIKGDPLLEEFGVTLVEQFSAQSEYFNHIRNCLRMLGRFVVAVKKTNPAIKCLEEVMQPAYFDLCVSAALEVAGYDVAKNSFKCPSNAKRIGEYLDKCAGILTKQAIKSQNDTKKKLVADFLTLRKIDWSVRVSSKASLQLKESRYNAPEQLPDKEDVTKLADFMDKQIPITMSLLEEFPSAKVYQKLLVLTLTSVIVLNRKRPGDVHKLHVEDFNKVTSTATHTDIWESLTPEEKSLVESLKRVETRGKKFMKVPILFTQRMQDCVKLMLKYRSTCGVPNENKYVFGNVGTTSFMRGSDCLRQIRKKAKCSNPDRITATCLRKEAATLAKVAGLSETQVKELAEFLGHDIRTHMGVYRLPQATLQTAKVSKYLMKISKGSGKHLTNEDNAEDSAVDEPEDREEEREGKDDTLKMDQTAAKRPRERIDSGSSGEESEYFTPKKRVFKKKRWTTPQREAVKKHLGAHIALGEIPGKAACMSALKESPLRVRKWTDVKNFCRNAITAKKKM